MRHDAADRELCAAVTLAVGMPANERMDTLVEKATELGVAAIQPLRCERSVLRLAGDRAQRKREHWQAIAVAACEQCGRTRVPRSSRCSLRTCVAARTREGAPLRVAAEHARDDALPCAARPCRSARC